MLNNKRQYIYSYDYKNRLVTIEKNIYKKVNNSETDEVELKEKIVQIKYDVLWRRIQKLFNNGGYRNYIYSNQHVILEENYSKKDKLKNSKEFIYSNSLDEILSMKLIENKTRKIEEEFVNKKWVTKTRKIKESYVETNTYFYQKDHLGSIIAITDETGTIVEEYVYDIFGKPYSKQIDWKITKLKKSPVGNTRMYTGREYDRGLKLYYNRARYYDPKLARFISRDPIDIADDVNLYAYVGNNSIMYTDPSWNVKNMIANWYDTFTEFTGLKSLGIGLGSSAAYWVGYATWNKNLENEGRMWVMAVKNDIYIEAAWYATLKVWSAYLKYRKAQKLIEATWKVWKETTEVVIQNQLRSYPMGMPKSQGFNIEIIKNGSKISAEGQTDILLDFVIQGNKLKTWIGHSFIAWWKNVNYAWTIKIWKNWKVSWWWNHSGHYTPKLNDTVWLELTEKLFKEKWIKLVNFKWVDF